MLAAFLWIGVLFIDVYGFSLLSLHCVWFGASALQVCVHACVYLYLFVCLFMSLCAAYVSVCGCGAKY